MINISIIKCSDYDEQELEQKIIAALDKLGGLKNFISYGDKVVLKPNLLSAKPGSTCVTTNPKFVKFCAKIIKDFGAHPVVGDSPPMHGSTKIAKKIGLLDELNEIGVELIEFKTPVKLKVSEDAIFKDIFVAKEALEADALINLPKIKSHTQMTLTGCVKNIFGVVIGKEKPMWHLKAGIDKSYFAHMLLDLYYGVSPILTLADMITVMEGDGPSSGTKKHVGAIVAGSDCVAMDTVISNILEIPFDINYILTEVRHFPSHHSTEIQNINILSDGLDEIRSNAKGFKLPKMTDSDFGMPSILRKLLRDSLTSKPYIDISLCKYCKECENICPADVISISKDDNSFDYKKCIKCFCCQEICPYGALKVMQGSLLRLIEKFQ